MWYKEEVRRLWMDLSNSLTSPTGRYMEETPLGSGTLGQVVRCQKLESKEIRAVKIMRTGCSSAGKHEVAMIEKLRQFDENENNLIS